MKHSDIQDLFMESYLDLNSIRIVRGGDNFYIQESEISNYMEAAGIEDMREAINDIIEHYEEAENEISKDSLIVLVTNESTLSEIRGSGIMYEAVDLRKNIGKFTSMVQDKIYKMVITGNAKTVIKNIPKFAQGRQVINNLVAEASTASDYNLIVNDCRASIEALEAALDMDVTPEQRKALLSQISFVKSTIAKIEKKKPNKK